MKHITSFFLLLILSALCVFALSGLVGSALGSGTVLVSAAASLTDALQEINTLYRGKTDSTVRFNFAASGPLQQQIEQGAPVDIFIAAANKQMDILEQKNLLLPETRSVLLRNRLVLVTPKNSRLGITDLRSLTGSGVKRIAVGEFRSVPAGQYTEEVLQKVGILAQVRSKLVFSNSVRSVLAAVAAGNADAGFVYSTDARISEGVRVVQTIPENLHAPIVYPIAIIKSAPNLEGAKDFLQFLQGSAAKAIFSRYGFRLP